MTSISLSMNWSVKTLGEDIRRMDEAAIREGIALVGMDTMISTIEEVGEAARNQVDIIEGMDFRGSRERRMRGSSRPNITEVRR